MASNNDQVNQTRAIMNTQPSTHLNESTIPEMTIADLVTADYRTAGVFRRYGLDFCCGGRRTIGEACATHNIDSGKLLNELGQVMNRNDNTAPRFNAWSPELLIRFIVDNHHSYVREALNRIPWFVGKVASRHAGSHPENVEIAQLFEELSREMTEHMVSEEQEVFPLIERYLKEKTPSDRQKLEKLVGEMETEHTAAGELMARIRELSNGFNTPRDACNTYRVAYAELEAFERDLHQHVHLENNVLFPKVLNS
jgi:regulator of cell morphogenesis and NO signaling